MLSPKISRGLILIFWPVTAPEQPWSNSIRKYSGIFPVVAAIFLIVVSEACANKSLCWSAECALNVRQTSVCRDLIGKPIERSWRAFLPDRDKLEVRRTFGVA